MDVSFTQGEGFSPFVSDDDKSMMYPGVTKAEISFLGSTLSIIEFQDSVIIDLEYHDGNKLRLEEISK